MIKDVSAHRQVLCITHLPQVAAYADAHLSIQKHQGKDRTCVSGRAAPARRGAYPRAGADDLRGGDHPGGDGGGRSPRRDPHVAAVPGARTGRPGGRVAVQRSACTAGCYLAPPKCHISISPVSKPAGQTAEPRWKVVSAGLTDVGRKRDHNEDSYLIDDELHLYVVADGMGGHAGGGTASRIAVETIDRELRRPAAGPRQSRSGAAAPSRIRRCRRSSAPRWRRRASPSSAPPRRIPAFRDGHHRHLSAGEGRPRLLRPRRRQPGLPRARD